MTYGIISRRQQKVIDEKSRRLHYASSVKHRLPKTLKILTITGCSKRFYQPGNHELQAGSWLKNV